MCYFQPKVTEIIIASTTKRLNNLLLFYHLLTAGNIAGRNAHQPSTLHSPCTYETIIIYYKTHFFVLLLIFIINPAKFFCQCIL